MLLFWPGVILAWSDGGDDTMEALEGGSGARAGVHKSGDGWWPVSRDKVMSNAGFYCLNYLAGSFRRWNDHLLTNTLMVPMLF